LSQLRLVSQQTSSATTRGSEQVLIEKACARMQDLMQDGRPPRQEPDDEGKVTTLMFRNVPLAYTQDMFLEELTESLGMSDTFDFLYMPWDLQRDQNVGFAFVNFIDERYATSCKHLFANFLFKHSPNTNKPCKICPARVQGLINNVRNLMERVVSESHSHYPIIVLDGKQLKLGTFIAELERQRRRMNTGNKYALTGHDVWAALVDRLCLEKGRAEDIKALRSAAEALAESRSRNARDDLFQHDCHASVLEEPPETLWDDATGVPPPLRLVPHLRESVASRESSDFTRSDNSRASPPTDFFASCSPHAPPFQVTSLQEDQWSSAGLGHTIQAWHAHEMPKHDEHTRKIGAILRQNVMEATAQAQDSSELFMRGNSSDYRPAGNHQRPDTSPTTSTSTAMGATFRLICETTVNGQVSWTKLPPQVTQVCRLTDDLWVDCTESMPL